jgi:hypothetical protein
MTLTRTDPEPNEFSLVGRRGTKWLRRGDGWFEQTEDGEAGPITWAELVDDEAVDLLIEGLTGLPPTTGHGMERRQTMRSDHP